MLLLRAEEADREGGGHAGSAGPVLAGPRNWAPRSFGERRDVGSMLAGILFLVVVLAVAVLITVDVVRTPNEAAIGQADWYAQDGAAVQAFSREPVVREQSVPAPAPRIGAGPAEVDSFERPDQAARGFDQRRHGMPLPAGGDAALRGRSSGMFVNLSRR